MSATPSLVRHFNLPLLTLYGLGTVLGAGIYVLVGEVAAAAGTAAPVSFLLASLVALLTGLSFGELAARYPEAAGEAVYVREGLGGRWLPTVVGLMVALSGLVSAAAISVGFAGYFRIFLDVPGWVATGGLVILLGLLAAWGIRESVAAAAVMTVIEVIGLLLVVGVAGEHFLRLPEALPDMVPRAGSGVVVGTFLAFYAFIGFEDMVNSAEEVKDPERTMPIAILLALGLASVLYLAVAVVCVLALPLEELAGSKAPLATVWEHETGQRPLLISGISLIAVSNGALVNLIMASRVLYGLARRGWLPASLGRIHPRRRTPLLATGLVTVAVLVLATAFPLSGLAQVTSTLLLVVFGLVNLALLRLQSQPHEGFRVPRLVPLLAVASILLLLGGRFLG